MATQTTMAERPMPSILDYERVVDWQAAWQAWDRERAAATGRQARIRAARSNAARRHVDMTPGAEPPRCDYGHCREYATQTVDNRGRERRPMCGRHADLVIRLDSGNTATGRRGY